MSRRQPPNDRPFWETSRLSDMTAEQWEALCDGCGRCCLVKLMDEDTDEVFYTDVACRLLDGTSCRCRDYQNRRAQVSDCVVLKPATMDQVGPWLPATCAYRRLWEGRGLPAWHPLVTGDPESVHRAGISVRGRTVPETDIPEEVRESRVVDWPWDER